MVLSNTRDKQGAVARGAAASLIPIYEVTYPDDRRRAAGEGDEAFSSALFLTSDAAMRFKAVHGGTVAEKRITRSTKQGLVRAGLLPRTKNSRTRCTGR